VGTAASTPTFARWRSQAGEIVSKPRSTDPRHNEDTQVLTRKKLTRPPLYKVIFHNDDYTTRDFVVLVLMRFFHKSQAEASTIMLHVHTRGRGVAGIYPHDIAATKIAQVEQLASQHQMPLRLTMEPDDAGGGGEDGE
jgi:ATP-dependent Clp protease adaptor protein ClpS